MKRAAVILLLTVGLAACASEPGTPAPAPGAAEPAAAPPSIPKPAPSPPAIGGAGTIAVPSDWTPSVDIHSRQPWELPAGATRIRATVEWTDSSWGEVEVAIGTGICPHRGVEVARGRSAEGRVVVEHVIESPDPNAPPSWFVHVSVDAAAERKKGSTFAYTWRVETE